MIVYVVLSVLQLKIQKKGLAVAYGFMLGFTFLLFFSVSGGLFYASRGIVRENLYAECNNASSHLHKADALYAAANVKLCSAACPCNADASLWQGYLSQQAQQTSQTTQPNKTAVTTNPLGTATNTALNTATTAQNSALSMTMITSENGVDNF
jgi:hypothetical protein